MKNQSSNDNTEAKWERLVDFTALCAWIITSTTMAVIAYSSYGMDLRGYYAAAHVLLSGGNLYDYSLVASVLLDLTGRAITLFIIHLARTTWKFEQTGILLLAITVETLFAFRKQQWNPMGLYLALAAQSAQ